MCTNYRKLRSNTSPMPSSVADGEELRLRGLRPDAFGVPDSETLVRGLKTDEVYLAFLLSFPFLSTFSLLLPLPKA